MNEPFDADRYYLQLGRFISIFAVAESSLRILLATLLNMDNDGQRAFLSGTRADAAISFVRRHYASKEMAIPTFLDRALSQFSSINSARNDLVHFVVKIDQAGALWSNREKVPNPSEAKIRRIDNETMEALRTDTAIIGSIFAAASLPLTKLERHKPELLSALSEYAWQYKPPQPEPARRSDPQRTNGRPRRQHPPRSSRGK